MPELNTDWLVSVDDHAIEPPNVWLDRLPAKYHDIAPRMVATAGGEAWQYEDKQIPTSGLSVAAGKRHEDFSPDPVPFSEMRPGAYDSVARLADMDQAGILASMCFPSFPRFCGQIFWEAKDKDLAALCVRAYNDWMIDEWCGSAPGRYIPLVIIPLWDPPAAAKELERCAAKGATSFAFSENPEPLGLPTIHDPSRYWDPVMAAAQDLQMVISMHVGSSSTMPSISSNAPALASLTFGASRAAATMLSWLFSDYFQRMPGLKIALSEGNIGWMPYFIERAEQVLDRQRHWIKKTSTEFYNLKVEDSTQADLDRLNVRESFRDHIYGCFIEETSGLRCLDIIGEDNVMVETDYPHTDTTWPHSIDIARKLVSELPAPTQYKILRGNAERLYRFTPADPPRDL
jgi:predicted TIM-barrel fold metal-dependent hydrolase